MGDGASWIARQMKQRFGSQGSYLLDFYHVCDYLSAAAKAIENEASTQQARARARRRRTSAVRRCYRYLSQRQDQLDYEGAINQGLPISPGEIESAQRYLIQKWLKLPGAWWQVANAENMLALRVNRANGEWKSYWSTTCRYAP